MGTDIGRIEGYAALAAMPPEQMLDIRALAACLSCSTRTVWRWVRCSQLPPPVRIGNRVVWTVKCIREHMERRLRQAEDAARREAERLRDYAFRP